VLLNWNVIGNPNRGNGYADKAEAEVDLKNHFGVTKIVWADGPISGDAGVRLPGPLGAESPASDTRLQNGAGATIGQDDVCALNRLPRSSAYGAFCVAQLLRGASRE
jgi:hypothetical protein